MVPHSWILELLVLTGIALNIQRLVLEGNANRKTVLTSNSKGKAKASGAFSRVTVYHPCCLSGA